MHSPNTIPQNWNTFTELETGLYYEIRYNRWKTVLLRPPYKTGCDKYDLDSISGYRLRSDCVNHCITKELDITCMKCGHNTSDCQQCFVRFGNISTKIIFPEFHFSEIHHEFNRHAKRGKIFRGFTTKRGVY